MIILTIDTDWAPDRATAAVLEKVNALGVKVTVFFSTPSPGPAWPLLEVGAHPDLSRRVATERQGDGLAVAHPEHQAAAEAAEERILTDYRRAFPEARAVRTHRFHWHSDLSRVMVRTGFAHDSSMILPYHPGLKGFRVGRLTRWPVWASDHLHLARRLPLDHLAFPNGNQPGLKIFCFHVAYLHLNAAGLDDFNMISHRLESAAPAPARPQARPGVWDLFQRLAEKIHREQNGGSWLDEIPPEYLVDTEIAEVV